MIFGIEWQVWMLLLGCVYIAFCPFSWDPAFWLKCRAGKEFPVEFNMLAVRLSAAYLIIAVIVNLI